MRMWVDVRWSRLVIVEFGGTDGKRLGGVFAGSIRKERSIGKMVRVWPLPSSRPVGIWAFRRLTSGAAAGMFDGRSDLLAGGDGLERQMAKADRPVLGFQIFQQGTSGVDAEAQDDHFPGAG